MTQISSIKQSSTKNRQKLPYMYQSKVFRSSQASDIMSIATQRLNYAIQSIPHQIKHNKTAFKDYFQAFDSLDLDLDQDIEEESLSNRPISTKVKSKNFQGNNYYAEQKSKIAIVLKDNVYRILKQSLTKLKNHQNFQQTAKKVPTFSTKKPEIKIQPNPQQIQNLQNSFRFVGRISKQMLSTQTSPKSKTASKYKFVQNQQTYFQNHIPIVNKLLYIQGASLLENYGEFVNPNFNLKEKNIMAMTAMKRFSIKNQK